MVCIRKPIQIFYLIISYPKRFQFFPFNGSVFENIFNFLLFVFLCYPVFTLIFKMFYFQFVKHRLNEFLS